MRVDFIRVFQMGLDCWGANCTAGSPLVPAGSWFLGLSIPDVFNFDMQWKELQVRRRRCCWLSSDSMRRGALALLAVRWRLFTMVLIVTEFQFIFVGLGAEVFHKDWCIVLLDGLGAMFYILNAFELICCGFVTFVGIGTNGHGISGNHSRSFRLFRCREAPPAGGGDIILTDCTYCRVCTAVCI